MARNLAFLKWVIVLTVWGLVCLIGAKMAAAHSFYPWECCSDQDCWPMGDAADAREPEPSVTPSGWRLADGEIVAYAAARSSPDGRFHVCRKGGRADGAAIRPPGKAVCLWVPMGAS